MNPRRESIGQSLHPVSKLTGKDQSEEYPFGKVIELA